MLLSPPRRISVNRKDIFHIFLDGACTERRLDEEWSGTSIGGVVFNEHGNGVGCFGEVLPPLVTDAWRREDKEQLIFEAELMPYVTVCCGFVSVE